MRRNREWPIGVARESLERLKTKVREMWRSCQSRTSNQLRDAWQRFIQGGWGYCQRAEDRPPPFRREGGMRRDIRKCFGRRWHAARGREHALRQLGVSARWLPTEHAGGRTRVLRR